MRALAVALAFPLALLAIDDTKEVRSPNGWWTIRVPATWVMKDAPDKRFKESVTIADPANEHFLRVQVMEAATPLGELAAGIKGNCQKQGTELLNEADIEVNGCKAWRYEVVVKDTRMEDVRTKQVLVEAGDRKALLSAGLPEPSPEEAWKPFEQALSAFSLAPAEIKLEWKARTFDHLALTVDLPVAEGEAENYPDSVQVGWRDLGVFFQAECERSGGPLPELFDFNMGDEPLGLASAPEVLSREEVETAHGKGIRGRVRAKMKGGPTLVMSVLCFRASEGETWALMVGAVGTEFPPLFARIEEAFLKAKVGQRHFAEPVKATPEPTGAVESWGGAARIPIPEGWESVRVRKARDVEGAPVVEGRESWAAEGANDLGMRAERGTIDGGQEAYATWLRKAHANLVESPKLAGPRKVDVGGKEGLLWEVELGPKCDRRVIKEVVVFDDAEYWALRSSYPVGLAEVYGPLVERAAAKVVWTK